MKFYGVFCSKCHLFLYRCTDSVVINWYEKAQNRLVLSRRSVQWDSVFGICFKIETFRNVIVKWLRENQFGRYVGCTMYYVIHLPSSNLTYCRMTHGRQFSCKPIGSFRIVSQKFCRTNKKNKNIMYKMQVCKLHRVC